MTDESSRARDEADGPSGLATLLEPHLDTLGEAARAHEQAERELAERAAAARASRRRLDEAELMALIFEHLDPNNPRICEGIEFDRLVILTEPAQRPESRDAEPEPAAFELAPDPQVFDAVFEIPSLDARDWVGRAWTDDIRPIPAEVLDRPELDDAQRGLLTRARIRAARHALASLNLRRLSRDYALRHLELFIHACRAERVRFCRVIPGKGVDSRAEPVIKRAVIEWCRAPEGAGVLGWAPELDRHGEWGAMILELRSPTR